MEDHCAKGSPVIIKVKIEEVLQVPLLDILKYNYMKLKKWGSIRNQNFFIEMKDHWARKDLN